MLRSILKYFSNFISMTLFYFCLTNSAIANQTFPVMWNLQNSNEYFVGREEFLKNMHKYFFNKSNSLIITGFPGSGKAQVVKRYAELHKEKYDIVWRFDANKNLSEQYINFAKRWNKVIKKYYKDDAEQNFLQINLDSIDANIIEEQVHYRFKTTKLNWLIIFDNVENSNDMLENLPKKYNSKGYGHVIILTTNVPPNTNVMLLDKFTHEESIELLLKMTGENDVHNASLLADILEDHPLAVASAGSFIAFYKSISIEEYNRLFLTERKELLKKEQLMMKANNNSKLNVITTQSLIIKEVKKESRLAYDLLAMIAFLDNKNIPESLLIQYIKDNNQNSINLNANFKNALSILLKSSLLLRNYPNKNTEENKLKKESLFSVHSLTQLVMQDLLKPEEKRLYLNKSITAMNNLLPNNVYLLTKSLSKSFYVRPHITMLSKYASDFKLYNNDVIQLELRALEYNLSGIRNDKEAEILINRIEDISQKLIKADQEKINLLKIRLAIMKSAYLAWVKADYHEALKEALCAYNLIKTLPSSVNYYDEYLMIYNRLARLYSITGDNINAFKYAYLGKEIIDNSEGFLDYKNDFLKILVKVYIDNGDYVQALKYSDLTLVKLNWQEEVLPGDIAAYIINADILIRMGKYKEAMHKLDLLNKIAERFLPNEHILYKANIMSYHSYVKSLLGGNRAIETTITSQQMLKKLLGEENYYKSCHVYMSHKFLGEIYEQQGDYLKAEQEYFTGLRILINTYNNNDQAATDDLSDFYYKLAIIHIKLAQNSKAANYIRCHYQVFGREHPRSTKIMDYLVENNINLRFQ